jgi:hypothetical protein
MANAFKNYLAVGVGTTANAVYSPTASGIQSTVIGMTIANVNTVPIYASVLLNSGSANAYVVKNALVPTGGALVPIGGDQKLVMEQNDVLYVVCDKASSADIIVSVLEIT